MPDAITASTLVEADEYRAAGCVELTKLEYGERVALLGYRWNERKEGFNYTNTANERRYKARSAQYYTDVETGIRAFHFQGRRDARFDQLQAMRRETLVFHRGRIYEL